MCEYFLSSFVNGKMCIMCEYFLNSFVNGKMCIMCENFLSSFVNGKTSLFGKDLGCPHAPLCWECWFSTRTSLIHHSKT
jgi:hypothetical protein